MKATVQGEDGKPLVMTMGCYGIGVTRVVASAIEQHHDDRGIIWPQMKLHHYCGDCANEHAQI